MSRWAEDLTPKSELIEQLINTESDIRNFKVTNIIDDTERKRVVTLMQIARRLRQEIGMNEKWHQLLDVLENY